MMLPQYMTLDGGLGTELADTYGHPDIDGDPLWSSRLIITDIDSIKKAHTSFLVNGADVVRTVTYQCSVQSLEKHLSIGRSEAIDVLKLAVSTAIEARDEFWKVAIQGRLKPLVSGVVGSYGACLCDCSEYTGVYVDHLSTQELVNWHRPRVAALLEAGVDILSFVTIPAQKEAEAIELLLHEFPNCQAFLTYSCKDGEHTCHGEELGAAVASLSASKQIVGVGVNCTPPQHIESLLRQIPDAVKQQKAIVIYPNSGEKWCKEDRWSGKATCQPVSTYVKKWMALGATWIGGCCRVSPADVADIRQEMQDYIAALS